MGLVARIIDGALGTTTSTGTGLVGGLVGLALLLPILGVAVRRLHDTDKRGWWVLIGIIPVIGTIVLIVFYATDSNPGSNRLGPSPKGCSRSFDAGR